MPQFSTTHRVRHAAAEMFDLVADVEKLLYKQSGLLGISGISNEIGRAHV